MRSFLGSVFSANKGTAAWADCGLALQARPIPRAEGLGMKAPIRHDPSRLP